MASPANEFEQLERILGKLYENPFDEESLHYAQRAHARLDDKLRSVDVSSDEELYDYAKTPTSPAADPISPITPPVPNLQEDSQQPAQQNTGIDTAAVQRVVDKLSEGDSAPTMRELSKIIQLVSANPQLDQVQKFLTSVLDGLENKTGEGDLPNLEVPATSVEPTTPLATKKPGDYFRNAYTKNNGGKTLAEMRAEADQEIEDEDMTGNVMAEGLDYFMKIADAIDKELPDVAQILDQYIEEYMNEFDNLTKFPQFGKLIREIPSETAA